MIDHGDKRTGLWDDRKHVINQKERKKHGHKCNIKWKEKVRNADRVQ